MVKKTCLILLFFLGGCVEPTKIHTWRIHWDIFNASDSLRVTKHIKYILSVTPDQYKDGPFVDSIRDGTLQKLLYFNGDKTEFLKSNPKLNAQIISFDTIVFDSTFTWDQLNFQLGRDEPNDRGNYVSYDTLYIRN